MNDKAKIAALRAALKQAFRYGQSYSKSAERNTRDGEEHARQMHAQYLELVEKTVLTMTADDAEQAPEKFTDAMYLAWDGFDNSMSCEERAAIYFAVRAVDPAAPVADTGAVSEMATVIAYLNGEGPLDGFHFGERNYTQPGSFWWRKHLMAAWGKLTDAATPTATADSAADALIGQLQIRIAELEEDNQALSIQISSMAHAARDAARLDWLIENQYFVGLFYGMFSVRGCNGDRESVDSPTARGAIDAAMKKEG